MQGRLSSRIVGIYKDSGYPVSVHSVEQNDLSLLPERVPYGNKGTFGKVLLVAGSPGMCGAAYLSAAAALKCSAGMVKVRTVEETAGVPLHDAVAGSDDHL